MTETATPRTRMIESAALLMRERGVQATSFSEVLAHSGAPRGSIYHHFPGGKAQLIEEATRYAGEFTAAGLVAALEQPDPAAAIHMFAGMWKRILSRSDFEAGCPVVAATLEGDPVARGAAAAAFTRWEELLADAFERRGLGAERAQSVATIFLASIEGAVVLSRAQQSAAPLERVATELERLLVAALS
jgi:TetR/AcrR family transcriptional regulator, lmrAB and yxaGH operons repressor